MAYRTERLNAIRAEHNNIKEILDLPPSYESLAESTDLLQKIDQWETETIRQVKEIAEQIRNKIRQRSDTVATERFQPEFRQLTEAIHQSQQLNDADLQQLMKKVTDLKLEVEDTLLTIADIRTIPIQWLQHIRIVTKPSPNRFHERNINLNNLTNNRTNISLDVKGFDWHILSTFSPVDSFFLHYQNSQRNKRLSRISFNGHQTPITWFQDQSIWDICWSTHLNKFIILADTRLYIYDEANNTNPIQLIEKVQPKQLKMEFLRCACSNETILITYDERNSSIDEYQLDQWSLVQHHENIVHKNEIIISIAFSETNSNLIGMTILDDHQYWYFELRTRSLSLISSLPLDKSEFNRRLISLPNSSMNWFIIHMGTKLLSLIDQNGQHKRTIECAENVDLASYSRMKNFLVLLTQKSKLKFFDV